MLVAAAGFHPKHGLVHHFFLEADAAPAKDAAFLVQDDQIAQRHMLREVLLILILEATLAGTMLHGEILQRAFASLIADGTIQRMGGEQKLDDLPPGFHRLLTHHAHDHALAHR